MRLAIDASRVTVERVTGTERYAIRMIEEILRQNHTHAITLYFRNQPPRDLFPTEFIRRPDLLTRRVIPFPRAWTHARFAAALTAERHDLVWVPAHTLPFLFPGKAAVTVHDLGYRHFPAAHPFDQRLYLDLTTPWSAARAAVVLADSHATAADLTRFYGTRREKVHVVYPGVDALTIENTAAVREKYKLPDHYWLFIGTLQPRKNIARIVQAYQRWRDDHPLDRAALVLAGAEGWLFDPEWVEGVDGVILPGFVDDADKGALYAGAVGLVFPSLYEGFGFPVVEAMHCGTPVITSNTSSLIELAGDAAILVDPLDVDAIATSMGAISDDSALRAELIEKGYAQAKRFTWDSAASAALAAFETIGER